MLKDDFVVRSGSTIGTQHRILNKNNQDAYSINIGDNTISAFVCDGCGSAKYSEAGARIVSVYLNRQAVKLSHILQYKNNIDKFLIKLKNRTMKFIHEIVKQISYTKKEYINHITDKFLFTIFGVVITETTTIIFRFGDGAYVLNGEFVSVDENNTPSYLAYNLLDKSINRNFIIENVIESKKVSNILLCTDGINYLMDNTHKTLKDGSTAGTYQQFIENTKYIENPSLLQKRLVVLSEVNKILKDDTSIILIKRRINNSM